ncbi:hypothetical protein GTQ40_01490 [Flavobacteriaceae bacterium R38]|nr:hypothetical protein [Flavobacteriaceae bacterium R38]
MKYFFLFASILLFSCSSSDSNDTETIEENLNIRNEFTISGDTFSINHGFLGFVPSFGDIERDRLILQISSSSVNSSLAANKIEFDINGDALNEEIIGSYEFEFNGPLFTENLLLLADFNPDDQTYQYRIDGNSFSRVELNILAYDEEERTITLTFSGVGDSDGISRNFEGGYRGTFSDDFD